GVLLNIVLLYSIINFSGVHMGTYKYLLITFTESNLCLIILHELVHPKITALNAALQSLPFALLAVHFLYRYWCMFLICSSSIMPQFFSYCKRLKFKRYLMSMYGTTGQNDDEAKKVLMNEYEMKYGKRIENVWIILNHWVRAKVLLTPLTNQFERGNELNVTLLLMVVFLNVMMITSILAILTFIHLNLTSQISTKANQIQRKLLIALCAQ
ncbi:hypothetical protein PMAYCL1PPCAC_21082, partial [Pristionchus mayeri]